MEQEGTLMDTEMETRRDQWLEDYRDMCATCAYWRKSGVTGSHYCDNDESEWKDEYTEEKDGCGEHLDYWRARP